MKIVNGITVPDGSDLSSASALRMFAEDVDARIKAAWDLHHAARHPDCAIIGLTTGGTVPSGAWGATGNWNILQRSTKRNPASGIGMSLGNGTFQSGIYLVGGTLNYYTFGGPSGIDLRLTIYDETGTKYNVPVTTESISTKNPSAARGEEFERFAIPAEFHRNIVGDITLEAYVHGGANIVCQGGRSKMWLWRVRGLTSA